MGRIIDLKRKGYQGPRPYRVDYFDTFKKRKRIHFKTEKEAKRFLTTIEAEILKAKEGLLPDWFFNGGNEELTIGQLYKHYEEEEIDLKKKESARRSAKRILNGIIQRFKKIKASHLDGGKIRDYRHECLKSGGKETSFQTRIKAFKTMLSWGVKNGYIARNPLNGYELKRGVKAEEKEALDDDQIRRFILALKDSRPEILDYFILGVNTGMRIRELWSLEWDQVDIEKRTIDLPGEKTKTNKARKVPFNNHCMDVINRLYVKKEDAPYVLWHPNSANTLTEEIGKLSKSLLGKKHTPHFWRVTFATRALRGKRIKAENGQIYWVRGDLKTVAEIGGWESNSKILVSIYQKVSEEQKRETVDLIGIGETDILPEPRDFDRAIDTKRHLIPAKA